MNREILFRGKRVNNEKWVEGYLFDDGYQEAADFLDKRVR